MGVEIEDAGHVASLIGTKIFADEFISFIDLVDMVCDKQIKVGHFTRPTSLVLYLRRCLKRRCKTKAIRHLKSSPTTEYNGSNNCLLGLVPPAQKFYPKIRHPESDWLIPVGWLKMTDMKLTDMQMTDMTRYISFENRLHYNAVCNSFQNNGRIQVTAAQ